MIINELEGNLMKNEKIKVFSPIWITLTGLFTAMVVVLSSFGIPVPGGHLYLNDVVICIAALIMDPLASFIIGGIGSFLGDFFFYPTPMFVSLVTHGIQAVVISLIVRKLFRDRPLLSHIVAVTVGALIMITGYTLGRAFIYASPETAMIKLPFQILQAAVGAILSVILVYKFKLREKLYRTINLT